MENKSDTKHMDDNEDCILNYNQEIQQFVQTRINKTIANSSTSILMMLEISNILVIATLYNKDFTSKRIQNLLDGIKKLFDNKFYVAKTYDDKIVVLIEESLEDDIEIYTRKIYDYVQSFKVSNIIIETPLHLLPIIATINIPEETQTAEDGLNKLYLTLKNTEHDFSRFYYPYSESGLSKRNFKAEFEKIEFFKKKIFAKDVRLAFQPIINTKDGSVSHYECLLRITDADNKIISAGPYIPMAEEIGFISYIDELVLEMVAEELSNSPNVKMTFNLSAFGINNNFWIKRAHQLLKNSNIAERTIIEITETSAHRDLGKTAYFIASFQELGCQVALDDFGSGHTSFRQLKSLPIDIIKIDGIFVRDIVTNHDSLLFVKTLIDMSQGFGFKSVAEFVENGEIAKLLMELKVDFMQGNYFCPAVNYRAWS